MGYGIYVLGVFRSSSWSQGRYPCIECWTSDRSDICRTARLRYISARSVDSFIRSCSVYECGTHWRQPTTSVTAPFLTSTSPKTGWFLLCGVIVILVFSAVKLLFGWQAGCVSHKQPLFLTSMLVGIFPIYSVHFRLRNDLYCVGWGVKLYSYENIVSLYLSLRLRSQALVWYQKFGLRDLINMQNLK